MTQESILNEIVLERQRQDTQWGSEHDDTNTPQDWGYIIQDYAICAQRQAMSGRIRHRFVQIAALAVAALESFDRKFPPS
jgi:carbonic anhydrase